MSDLDLIETERLVLSGWRADQVDDLVRMHGDPEIARYLTASGAPWSRTKCAAALEAWIGLFESRQLGKLRVRRKDDGAFVGRAGFGVHEPTGEPEIGYTLFREFRGRGYATEAAAALRDWIFRETDHSHFIGFAHVENAPSIAVLRRIGMIETGAADFEGMPCLFHRLEKSS